MNSHGARAVKLAGAPPKMLQEAHDDASKETRRVSLVLLVFVAFCALTISVPDRQVIEEKGTIELPLVKVGVDFNLFLLSAPILILVLHWYRAGLVMRRRALEGLGAAQIISIPTDFFPSRTRWIAGLVVPASIAALASRASNDFIATLLFVSAAFVLATEWWPKHDRSAPRHKLFVVVATVVVFIGLLNIDRRFQLSHVDLRGQDLTQWNLDGVRLRYGVIFTCDLAGQDIDKGDFSFANASRVNFTDTRFNATSFRSTSLLWANFAGAWVQNSDFRNARLGSADFTNATFLNCDFSGAVLTDVKFDGASIGTSDFSKAIGITQAQIDATDGRNSVGGPPVLPDGFTWPDDDGPTS